MIETSQEKKYHNRVSSLLKNTICLKTYECNEIEFPKKIRSVGDVLKSEEKTARKIMLNFTLSVAQSIFFKMREYLCSLSKYSLHRNKSTMRSF